MPTRNPDGSLNYTREELLAMPKAEAQALIRKAVKIKGTAVVQRADGSIKYDDPSRAGQYHEEVVLERNT